MTNQQDDPSEQGGFGMNMSKLLTATTLAIGFLLTSCASTQSNTGQTQQNSGGQQTSSNQGQNDQNRVEQAKSNFDSKFHRNGGA